MDLQVLRYFLQIAKEGSFTRAASQLYVSQPALSRAMKKLEAEFGVPLLDVRSNGVFLTDYGKALYEQGARLASEFDSLHNIVKAVGNLHTGALSIGVTPMLNRLFLEDILLNFTQMHPEIKVTVDEMAAVAIHKRLQEGLYDVALCIQKGTDDTLQETVLVKDHFVVCMAQNHPLAHQTSLRFSQLAESPFNFYASASTLSANIVNACQMAGFTPQTNLSSSNVDQIMRMTAKGHGICLFPEKYATLIKTSEIKTIPLNEDFPWVACMSKRTAVYQSAVSKAFEEYVLNYFKAVSSNQSSI